MESIAQKFGNGHTIYIKFSRWTKNRTIQQIFEDFQKQNIIDVRD